MNNTSGYNGGQVEAVVLLLILLIGLLLVQEITRKRFKDKQMEYSRVRETIEEKYQSIKEHFNSLGLKYPPKNIFIRIFKEEKILELWASSRKREPYRLVKTYEIAGSSGTLGPKRREGDRQIPEGFYYIEGFNPMSKYYLSLRINYPNESDRILGSRESLGGDIFIHGGINTVGCIPITDEGIKELYAIAVECVSAGQDRIPVHIFPRRLDEEGFSKLVSEYEGREELIKFWGNLKKGFDYFEEKNQLPQITVSMGGEYIFNR